MARSDEGLKSESLKSALDEALAGRPKKLEDLFARHGNMPSPRPNLKLAAAFGAEVSSLEGKVMALLARLADNDAAPDQPEVFLPIAGAHGLAGRIRAGKDTREAWARLCELAADERSPVRIGTLDALVALGARDGGADELVTQANVWLDESEEREIKFGAAGLALEALADGKVMATLRDEQALFDYVSRTIDEVADAPRAAERSEGRRRVLVSLPSVLATIVSTLSRGESGLGYFRAECARAKHPDVRLALSQALLKLRGANLGASLIDELRTGLEQSAKPLRYEALVRPGTGRGRRSRRTR